MKKISLWQIKNVFSALKILKTFRNRFKLNPLTQIYNVEKENQS